MPIVSGSTQYRPALCCVGCMHEGCFVSEIKEPTDWDGFTVIIMVSFDYALSPFSLSLSLSILECYESANTLLCRLPSSHQQPAM